MNRTAHFLGAQPRATTPSRAPRSPRPTARWHVAVPLCAAISLIALLASVAPAASPAPVQAASAPQVVVLSINGEIEPILAEYLDDGIAQANDSHAALVLITMNTPGGLEDSMQDIIQHILASHVPVAVYVSPSGSRGASAGFYILLSADIAAMAPATHTGSASPLIEIGDRKSVV